MCTDLFIEPLKPYTEELLRNMNLMKPHMPFMIDHIQQLIPHIHLLMPYNKQLLQKMDILKPKFEYVFFIFM